MVIYRYIDIQTDRQTDSSTRRATGRTRPASSWRPLTTVIYRYIDIQTDRQTDRQLYEKGYGKDAAGIAMEAINYGNI